MLPTARELADYMPLVYQGVARFLKRLPPNVLREDLVAAGTYGLVDALRKNPGVRTVAFEWYARIRIRGAIIDELRSQDWLTRRARDRRVADLGKDVSSRLLVTLDDLPPALETASDPTPHQLLEARCDRESVRHALDRLPEREQHIIKLHYFEGVQFKEIAKTLGVSEPRVSQLHARAVGMLRAALAA